MLHVQGLGGGYGDLTVLHDVDLEVGAGTLQVVLGRNGAGKTSLMSAIAGLLPTVRTGTISVNGRDVTALPAHKRAAAGIGLVQEGKRVFRARTVEENLLLGTYSSPGWSMRSAARKQALAAAYERFPVLHEKRADRAGGLSGGQQQMLAIAQALAADPKVLLLDEPSAGLAPAIRAEVFATARGLRDEGLAVVVVEQLVDVALDVADSVAVLDSGRIVSSGPPEQYRDGELLQAIYLGG
ncbi:ABC transporter ATP-binding protein [Dietzia sp. ANT_WB102]|uniref:ABC transporter ATP-binding protein n=1 Tax=Dietzia sp. ANT_WB102 TaxID=2597345 RepID=UPI0011EBB454|nr:ABC transporter ATP-binding protein [Dietzia sp. ANT_WB102]KAA0919918.1 ABC transporter ATP-binding protein [Dietzia sp. ANT_WB102]